MWVELVLYLFALLPAKGWWCTGHMLVAQIAQNDLQIDSPEAFSWANSLVQELSGPLTHNISNTFVESACWADDIKAYSLVAMNDWHFYAKPYNPDGLINVIEQFNGDALWAIDQLSGTLVAGNREEAPLETSFAMRYLIHIIGDIHQPLHVTEMWNEQYPNGDWGGVFFPIEFDSIVKELHALWDSCMSRYEINLIRPLNSFSWGLIDTEAADLMQLYPKSSLAKELSDPNTSDWALANYHLAVTYAYNITVGSRPTGDYLETGWEVIQKQLALAGYRLSAVIQQLYIQTLATQAID
jgi:hypothetical protein